MNGIRSMAVFSIFALASLPAYSDYITGSVDWDFTVVSTGEFVTGYATVQTGPYDPYLLDATGQEPQWNVTDSLLLVDGVEESLGGCDCGMDVISWVGLTPSDITATLVMSFDRLSLSFRDADITWDGLSAIAGDLDGSGGGVFTVFADPVDVPVPSVVSLVLIGFAGIRLSQLTRRVA